MGETRKQYERVREFSGKELLDDVSDFFEDVVKAVRELIKEGNNCRIRLVNKDGEEKFSTTVTTGTAGLLVAFILAPLLTIVVTLGVLLTEHTIIIEKEKPAETPTAGHPDGTVDG